MVGGELNEFDPEMIPLRVLRHNKSSSRYPCWLHPESTTFKINMETYQHKPCSSNISLLKLLTELKKRVKNDKRNTILLFHFNDTIRLHYTYLPHKQRYCTTFFLGFKLFQLPMYISHKWNSKNFIRKIRHFLPNKILCNVWGFT